MTSGEELTIGVQAQTRRRGALRPVAHRPRWILGGLGIQLVGLGAPIAYVYAKAKHLGVGDALTFATVKLAWHNSLHTKAGAALLIGSLVVFAIGSVLLARPFTRNVFTLVIAVPVASVVGALVLGVAALIIGVICVFGDAINSAGSGATGKGKKQSGDS